MVTYNVEVIDRFEDSHPAREYVYTPVPEDCELRETRVYKIDGPEDQNSLRRFVEDVLVDDVSQEWDLEATEDATALGDYDTVIDVTLKSDVLDLEEEYLLEYCENHRDEAEFDLEEIKIVTRYYLECDETDPDVVDTIVRDLVNPVIHEWSVTSRDNGC